MSAFSPEVDAARAPAARVLVVDDLEDYCGELSAALLRDGYDVLTASSAREAIELGGSTKLDVVLSDWMLRDHVNGLDVVQALSVVHPHLRAVLMTSFASSDLRADARTAEVFEFLEKPLQLGQVREVIRRAAQTAKPPRPREHVGFMEVNHYGTILNTNQPAEALIGRTRSGAFAQHLSDLFAPEQLERLEGAFDRWVDIVPLGAGGDSWQIRARRLPERETVWYVLLDHKHGTLRNSPVVCRLLGLSEPRLPVSLPIEGHILALDDFESVRRVTMDILKELNCVCLTARSQEEAIRLFSYDEDVKIVILDYEMPNIDIAELVGTMRNIRPEVRIIGTSGGSNKAEFERLGITSFLPKPWNLDQFFQALGAR